jgi:thioredoxin-like negative regulator of GroEL
MRDAAGAVNPLEGLAFIGAEEFEALRASGATAVVAFLATWNRRCQGFAGDYRALAARHVALPVVCVDVDENPKLTGALDVFSVPTVLLLAGGREACREVGLDLSAIEARLK